MTSTISGSILGLFNIGPTEMAFTLIIALLLFGKRLPEVARSMGKSIQEFKKGLNEAQQDIQSSMSADTTPVVRPTPEPVRPTAIEAAPAAQTPPPATDAATQQQTTKTA